MKISLWKRWCGLVDRSASWLAKDTNQEGIAALIVMSYAVMVLLFLGLCVALLALGVKELL